MKTLSDFRAPACPSIGHKKCSRDENFKFLNRLDDGKTAVELENPKTIEYQIVRTSLLPGLLKTIRENRKHALPLRIFEVSDVAFKDPKAERRARNERRVAAVFCGRKAGFEIVHGLLDRLMFTLDVKRLDGSSASSDSGYYIEATHGESVFDPVFLDLVVSNEESLSTWDFPYI
jgi:phenylalanyl-tRNA synthetase beta chain